MKKNLIHAAKAVLFFTYGATACFVLLHRPIVVHAQSFPGIIKSGVAGNPAVYVGTHAIGPGTGTNVPSTEQAIILIPWVNGPTGALDLSIPGYTYSITSSAAISSFTGTRTSSSMNFSTFNVTNPGASDLTVFITASGFIANDGSRSYIITNKSQREIRLSSSLFGVRGVTQPWY